MRLVLCALLLVACGDDDSSDDPCTCTVQVADAAPSALVCGQSACLSGNLYGCDNDDVLNLGICSLDGGLDEDGGTECVASQSSCSATTSCCKPDAGTAPTCDPITRVCCVAAGAPCAHNIDCCPGHACTLDPATQTSSCST